jgi:hypothetical protein
MDAVRSSFPVAGQDLHHSFVAILPRIEAHAQMFFRHLKCHHQKDDAVAEVVGLCWKWFVRLAQRGKDATEFATVLANFAARAVKSGRRVCGMEPPKDVLSPVAQQRHEFVVGKLPDFDTLDEGPLMEALRDNTQSPPDEQAAFRYDFPLWLSTLGNRNRQIAVSMALGHRTQNLASTYGLSWGRISQLRRELHASWQQLHDSSHDA